MNIKWSALAMVLALSACSALENFQPIGEYQYEGEKYDVYTADDVEHSDGEVNSSYYVLVPKGQKPHQLTVVARCAKAKFGGGTAAALKACEKIFGAQLRDKGTTAPRDEGGMDY